MDFKLGSQWLDDRNRVLEIFEHIVRRAGKLEDYRKSYPPGTILFEEGSPLNDMYILLEGSVQLYKTNPATGNDFPVDLLKKGAFIGLISFTTGNPSLTTAHTIADVTLLKIPRREFETYFSENPRIKDYLSELLLANLVERYKHTISLQSKLEAVNIELKSERNELKQAYFDLKKAQNRLIHQEKLATLGQLVAGFAHEVNNPAAALTRAVESMKEDIGKLFDAVTQQPETVNRYRHFFDRGLEAEFASTDTVRTRMKQLAEEFPKLSRSTVRAIAHLPETALEALEEAQISDPETIETILTLFDFGKLIRNSESAAQRIAGLVQSLKSYSRQDKNEVEKFDLREGLHDTLQLASNRIKYYDLKLELEDIPPVYGRPAEINQVWTNIIMNACDAMGKNGELTITSGTAQREDGAYVQVTIQDSGPGIREEMREKIFEPNVTSKRRGAQFGLGLGLTITRDIVQAHDGHIEVSNANEPETGAIFTVYLPVAE